MPQETGSNQGLPSMSQFRELLLEAWKESCQHSQLGALVADFAPRLGALLPLAAILVREFHPSRRSIETTALAQIDAKTAVADTPTECSAAQWKQVMAWAKTTDARQDGSGDRREQALALVEPSGIVGEVIAVPLVEGGNPQGVLLVVAQPGQRFGVRHRELAYQLAEPFTSALANERRRRELTTRRESAEADRASLLVRLGRREMLESIVGADKGLRFVVERVEMVASADAPVLLLGETGSGKEVIARAIHERSLRNGGPFIRVNCGAIPPELIDSQLFGHEKGSFTGASDQRQGWFERADGGTLFLDEIGELPLPAQVRLLRVLQDHHFERVGGQQAVHVDVRIVAATHRDLAEMVARGTFRQDLWYRVNVFPILIPRLADRTEDIPELVRHFARRASERFGLTYVEATAADLVLLSSYDWPGNVRELAAVIDRATILGRGKRLDVATALGWSDPSERPTAGGGGPDSNGAPSLGALPGPPVNRGVVSLNDAIRQHIQRALVAARGRIEGPKGAAAILEINPHTLRAKMRKLGIEWSQYRE
jgi:transcriptional regulator with GAF, ATPase, and Fis domain